MNFGTASQMENEPLTTATTAKRYSTRAVQSFVRFSPSTMLTRRRGAPMRRMISAGATASVGETIAPSTKAGPQSSPITSWATSATAPIVTRTSGIESIAIARALRRRSRTEVKNAAPYRSGGRKISSTRSGSRVTSGTPGMKPITAPPSTSVTG